MKKARDPAEFREVLNSRALTHRQLAKLADCSPGNIGHILNGRSVNDDLARRLAGHLGRRTADLFVHASSSSEQVIEQQQAVG